MKEQTLPVCDPRLLSRMAEQLRAMSIIHNRGDVTQHLPEFRVVARRVTKPAAKRKFQETVDAVGDCYGPLVRLRNRISPDTNRDCVSFFLSPTDLPNEIDELADAICTRALTVLTDMGRDTIDDDVARSRLNELAASADHLASQIQGERLDSDVWISASELRHLCRLDSDKVSKMAERRNWEIKKIGRLNFYRRSDIRTAWPKETQGLV